MCCGILLIVLFMVWYIYFFSPMLKLSIFLYPATKKEKKEQDSKIHITFIFRYVRGSSVWQFDNLCPLWMKERWECIIHDYIQNSTLITQLIFQKKNNTQEEYQIVSIWYQENKTILKLFSNHIYWYITRTLLDLISLTVTQNMMMNWGVKDSTLFLVYQHFLLQHFFSSSFC